jgi:hypothetical protein
MTTDSYTVNVGTILAVLYTSTICNGSDSKMLRELTGPKNQSTF